MLLASRVEFSQPNICGRLKSTLQVAPREMSEIFNMVYDAINSCSKKLVNVLLPT